MTVLKLITTAARTRHWPIGPFLFLSMASCTHVQLMNSTTHTASTVMDIQYQMVMDNLARMERSPAILPSQIRIKQGTIQVSDELGLYQLEASGALSGTFGGPRAERTVSEQWGADAISDPLAVKQLQDLYRAAMELPPLAAPNFLDVEKARMTGKGTANHGSGAASKDAAMRIDLRRDVPHGWFHVGTEGDVPGNARYVSHSGRTWIWAMPEDLAGLSRFTLLVLLITKLGPGENNGPEMGLMYTGGGR